MSIYEQQADKDMSEHTARVAYLQHYSLKHNMFYRAVERGGDCTKSHRVQVGDTQWRRQAAEWLSINSHD